MAAPDFLAWSEPDGSVSGHRPTKFARSRTVAALEQAVEMRDVAETRGKGDFGNGLVSRVVIEKPLRTRGNPLLVDMFAH